jgi:hypothetical protein
MFLRSGVVKAESGVEIDVQSSANAIISRGDLKNSDGQDVAQYGISVQELNTYLANNFERKFINLFCKDGSLARVQVSQKLSQFGTLSAAGGNLERRALIASCMGGSGNHSRHAMRLISHDPSTGKSKCDNSWGSTEPMVVGPGERYTNVRCVFEVLLTGVETLAGAGEVWRPIQMVKSTPFPPPFLSA